MNSQKSVLDRAIQLGHHLAPEVQVDLDDSKARKIQPNDRDGQEIVKSFQRFMAGDLDRFSWDRHKHAATIDGDIGPATTDLASMERCGYPDYGQMAFVEGKQIAVPKNADMAESNWPRTCRGELNIGRIFKNLPGATAEETDKMWWACANNWTQALADAELFNKGFVQDKAGLHVWAGLKRLVGSTLAWSFLAQNSCTAILEQAYNTLISWARDQLKFGAAVISHEVGHALGFDHNRDNDALMYPAIHSGSIARAGYPNQTDLQVAKSNGYSLSGLPQLPFEELWFPRDTNNPVPPPNPWDPPSPGKKVTHVRYYNGADLVKEVQF